MDEITTILTMCVGDIMQKWPHTVPIFLKYGLICVGCQLASFDTLADVLVNYGYSPDKIVTELLDAIRDVAFDEKGDL